MKSLTWIFIFFIICSEAKRSSAYMRINDVVFDLNGEDIRSKESFKRDYGKDIIAVGNLGSNRIENMKPHLTAIIEILPDNPLRTYFEYLLTLCNDYPKLRELDAITKNIYNFVAASEGTLMNSVAPFGGLILSDSFSPSGNGKLFIATSVRTDNENEIKSDFEKHEEAMKKVAEEQEKMLAKAAKMREEMLKTFERHHQAALEWAAKLRERITENLENNMTKAMGVGGIGGIGGMDWMGGMYGMEMSRDRAKEAKDGERSLKRRVRKDPRRRKNELSVAPITRKKKPNRSSSEEKIQNEDTISQEEA